MGARLQYCGLMALSTPIWVGAAAKLGWRMLTRCGAGRLLPPHITPCKAGCIDCCSSSLFNTTTPCPCRLSCLPAGPPATSALWIAAPPPSLTRCPACSTCWWTTQASGAFQASRQVLQNAVA